MMRKTFFSFSTFILYFIQFCFSNDVETLEGQSTSQKPLSFSFEKGSFRNFECYFDDRILSHESIYNPPFYYNKPVKNFFSIFGLIFQYSLIKNDESFKEVIKNLFVCHEKKTQNLIQNVEEFEYSPKKFNDHLNKLNRIILSVLEEKNNGIVTVEETDNRIIIRQKDSSVYFSIKLFEIIRKDAINVSYRDEYSNAIIENHTLFDEMYLKDLEHKSYIEFHPEVHKEYEKRGKSDCLTIQPSKDAFENLLKSYAYFKKIEKEQNKVGEVEEKINIDKLNESSTLHNKMYRGGKFTEYLNDLTSKTNAKLLFEVYKDPFNLDSFFIDPREGFKENMMNSLINMLQKSQNNHDKIRYVNTELTEESFENLLKNCLELSL